MSILNTKEMLDYFTLTTIFKMAEAGLCIGSQSFAAALIIVWNKGTRSKSVFGDILLTYRC